MLIRRIQVRNFRKFVDPVDISDLGPGLTVIAGDNEAGKSTLLDAIRAALFERHNVGGQVLERMLPYGSAVRPEIALDFEIDGGAYSLDKAFGRSPSVELVTPDGRFEGPAAEEKLAEILHFEPVHGRAGAEQRRESRGVLGLFWLEQGHVHHGLGLGGKGQRTIRGALEDEVGDVLGGTRGQRLLAMTQSRRSLFLTPKGRATGRLQEGLEAAVKARDEAGELASRLREYDEEIDRLGRLKADLAAFDDEDTIENFRARLADAKANADALEAIEREVKDRIRDLELAKSSLDAASNRFDVREALKKDVADARAAVNDLTGEHEQTVADAASWKDRDQTARDEHAATREAHTRVTASLRSAETAQRLKALTGRHEELSRLLGEVSKLKESRASALAEQSGIGIDRKKLGRIWKLDAQAREARVRRDVAATHVTPEPEAGREATLGGAVLAPGEAVEISGPSEIGLSGWGRLLVVPGSGNLVQLRADVEKAEAALADALADLDCADLAQAEAAETRRTEFAAVIREADQTLKAIAPNGIEALQDEAGTVSAKLQRLKDAMPEAGAPETASTGSEDIEALRAQEEKARAAIDRTAKALEQALAQKQKQDDAAIRLETLVAAAKAHLEATASRLAAARETVGDVELEQKLEAAQNTVTKAELKLSLSAEKRDAAVPEVVRLELERAQTALDRSIEERDRLAKEAHGLEMRLVGAGGPGLGEASVRAAALADKAEAEAATLQSEAEALDLLATVLKAAEAEAKELFLAPVLSKVAPYLRLVIPEAKLMLDDNLEISSIERDGRAEPYELLSVGTREQISVLVRLAFAVYLREKGFPAMVILDDTLVYSDPDRFDHMQLALRKAAETVQIIVLTCRPREWRSLGAPVHYLRDLTPAASA